ncbi:hypothetical protein CC86DRAFT_404577 [Ophiobolus disseminans]|uniref:Uncharacterized protein n=1 Tax=Ophiobolus disseminans TaxID=1469910 RepID=A0A6A7A7G3_9PLEO|nr:hypothetical protein CC86DRAFT_404577 [Ophiobolus disseminans]
MSASDPANDGTFEMLDHLPDTRERDETSGDSNGFGNTSASTFTDRESCGEKHNLATSTTQPRKRKKKTNADKDVMQHVPAAVEKRRSDDDVDKDAEH